MLRQASCMGCCWIWVPCCWACKCCSWWWWLLWCCCLAWSKYELTIRLSLRLPDCIYAASKQWHCLHRKQHPWLMFSCHSQSSSVWAVLGTTAANSLYASTSSWFLQCTFVLFWVSTPIALFIFAIFCKLAVNLAKINIMLHDVYNISNSNSNIPRSSRFCVAIRSQVHDT